MTLSRLFRMRTLILATFSTLGLLAGTMATMAHDDSMPGKGRVPLHVRENMRAFEEDHHHNEQLAAQGITSCSGGFAGAYPCSNIDLMAFLPLSQIGGGNGNDVWGWTDPLDGKEYAIMGLTNGTAFVDISDPVNPVFMAHLPPHPGVSGSSWRDIKTYDNHAFIGSEAASSGMQIVDLTQLRGIASPPGTITETAFYSGFSTSHNIVINEESGYAFGVGLNNGNCARGLHFVDISTPTSPQSEGCYASDGYTHDAQCVIYNGPDSTYVGSEVCFAFNEDTLTIVDVSNKAAPVQLSRTGYTNRGYSHQGWLTEDHAYLLLDDELDERQGLVTNTRTLIWNVSDLDNPVHQADYTGVSTTIDHNQYIVGNHSYQANYESGLRVIDISDIANGNLNEIGFFDIVPLTEGTNFNGAWSVYPFFASGNVVVSGIEQGLYILRPILNPVSDPPAVNIISPADGSPTVLSGVVPIQISATDDLDAAGTLTVEWNVDGGPWQPTSWVPPDYLASWDSNAVLDGGHVINARAVDSDLQAAADSSNVTTSNGTPRFTIDSVVVTIASGKGNRNTGHATVFISDDTGIPLSGVAVEGSFSGGWNGTRNSTTDGSGEAAVRTPTVKGLSFVQFCVDLAIKAGWDLDEDNSEICGDSDGGGGTSFGTLAGEVTDSATLAGIPNAAVSTSTGQNGNTDSFGQYSISNVPAGNLTVSVSASGYDGQSKPATVTDTNTTSLDFALTESTSTGAGTIRGTVRSASGSALKNATVQVVGGSSSQTNKPGKYSIQGVDAGLQTVVASASGYQNQQFEVNVIASGTVSQDFDLTPN